MGNVWLTGSTCLTIVRLLGIKVGAFYVADLIGGQIACENILKASERLSLAVRGKKLRSRGCVETQTSGDIVERGS